MTEGETIWQGWGSVLLVVSVSVLVLVLVGVLIWQAFKTYQTKLTLETSSSQEAAYRALAEQATAAQQQSNRQLTVLGEQVAELNTRLAAIERLLKQVE
jgi:cytochrome c-type biogenesis protein CcmH/NrfG